MAACATYPREKERIENPDPAKRIDAVDSMRKLAHRDSRAEQSLARALSDEDWRVALVAAEALSKLKARDPSTAEALVAASHRGIPDSDEFALSLRMGRAVTFGEYTWTALLKMEETAVPAVRPLLTDPHWLCRNNAAFLLIRHDPDVLQPLTAALDHDSAEVRSSAAYTLYSLRERAAPALTRLTELLMDKDHSVRKNCARAIGAIGPSGAKAIPALIELLSDIHNDACQESIEALSAMREASVTALSAVLGDSAADVRKRLGCAQALERMRKAAERATPALTLAVEKDEAPHVRWLCARALRNIGNAASGAGPALASRLKTETHKDTAIALVEAFDSINADIDVAVPALTDSLSHHILEVRGIAAGVLGRLGSRAHAAVPALLEHLRQDGDTHRAILQSLASILGDSGYVGGDILPRLKSPDVEVRLGGACMLGQYSNIMGEKAFSQKLQLALADPDPRVRLAACFAPRWFKKEMSEEALQTLRARKDDPDKDVRSAAIRTIEGLSK